MDPMLNRRSRGINNKGGEIEPAGPLKNGPIPSHESDAWTRHCDVQLPYEDKYWGEKEDRESNGMILQFLLCPSESRLT